MIKQHNPPSQGVQASEDNLIQIAHEDQALHQHAETQMETVHVFQQSSFHPSFLLGSLPNHLPNPEERPGRNKSWEAGFGKCYPTVGFF